MPISAPLKVKTSPTAANTDASIMPKGGTRNDAQIRMQPNTASINPSQSCKLSFVFWDILYKSIFLYYK